ncbi:MAG: hypothetical protein K9H49_12360 [Bacteroidales bacterium]|nr:hypothetical protein [Bacteroidales bacterium]MCF8390680.1 hypothetical protein [Bacteroidales bacterium]
MKFLVSSSILILIAGIMWAAVGCMLIIMASTWLSFEEPQTAIRFIIMGLILALVIYFGGFYKLVNKNLDRIAAMSEKNNIFSFISLKSYLIIPLMIVLGISLRHSEIDKAYLAIAYIAMGGALFLSSTKYFRALLLKSVK